jgi:hypothetical protein
VEKASQESAALAYPGRRSTSEETRKRNREKWELFVRYAARFGYRAGIGEAGKPFVNNHAEPIWSDDDHKAVWNLGEGGDFDDPYTEN